MYHLINYFILFSFYVSCLVLCFERNRTVSSLFLCFICVCLACGLDWRGAIVCFCLEAVRSEEFNLLLLFGASAAFPIFPYVFGMFLSVGWLHAAAFGDVTYLSHLS